MRWKRKKSISQVVNPKTIFFSLFILSLGMSFFFLKSNLFKIKIINITSQNIGCVDQNQIKVSSNLLGQNIFLVNNKKVEDNLKSKYFCIKKINLSKSISDRVKLSVFGREAIAKLAKINQATQSSSIENIATPSGDLAGQTYMMDDEGMIFSKYLFQEAVPTLYIDSDLSLGKKPNNVEAYLKILKKLKTFNLDLDPSLSLDNFLIIFPTIEQPKIIFRLDENIDNQIASLQLILEKAKIDSESLEFIDLRFDKPIVKVAPKKS